MRSQDIDIPEPCHADWDAMRPEDRGRFCFECSKTVHDLSAMTKDEARTFLRRNACNDICVSFEHDAEGTLVFDEARRGPEPTPEPTPDPTVVPISRLRRPRSVAAAVAGVGMAAALAACTPHGEEPVHTHAAEVSVFQSPSVVIPVGEASEAQPVAPTAEERAVEDEPCEPTAEPVARPEDRPRVRGKIKRTAGKPVIRVKGDVAGFSDPLGDL